MDQKSLVKSGVALIGVGMWSGLWSALALSGTVVVPIPHLALAVHLNGVIGGLWLIAVALSFPFLSYSEKQKKRLAQLVYLPAWANLLVTLLASFWGVRGISFNHDLKNNIIAVLLQLLVVLPTLAASAYWYCGFSTKRRTT